jgi:hypothetical protein
VPSAAGVLVFPATATSTTTTSTSTATTTTTRTKTKRTRSATSAPSTPLLSALAAILLLVAQPPQPQQRRPHNTAQAFNIDTQSATVHAGPPGSYFGYTVAQHRDRNQFWVLVGAPKAETSQPRVERGGAVYRCSPTPARACQQIPFDPNGHSMISVGDSKVQSDDKSHQWFGGSLQSSSDNGSIIACAPRYVYYTANLRRRDPVGACWISRGSFAGFLEYSPCRINGKCCRRVRPEPVSAVRATKQA